jgi:hypothetical protein
MMRDTLRDHAEKPNVLESPNEEDEELLRQSCLELMDKKNTLVADLPQQLL